jgi:3-hydroxyisobutyrate dehydrogenase
MKGSIQSVILRRHFKKDASLRLTANLTRSLSTSSSNLPENRNNAIAFIGLGAMGREMATNLFTKTASAHAAVSQNQSSPLSFVVCDAISEAATSFARSFRERFPSVNVEVVQTPGE